MTFMPYDICAKLKFYKNFSAFIGLLFCGFMLLPKDEQALCFSNGCQLFNNFTIFGISLWVFGLIAFLILFFQPHPKIARFFIIADCLFLLIMQLGLPCVNCMIVGCIFLFCFLSCINFDLQTKDKIIIGAWCALLILNLGSLFNEYGDYKIAGQGNTRIYFSPNCASCENTLKENPDASLYPIAEKDEDLAVIFAMQNLVKKGEKPLQALETARKLPADPPFWFKWALLKNKGRVLEFGGLAPLIIKNNSSAKKYNYIKDFKFE